MQLYFLSHGEADWPNWTKPDDERPLTDSGKKEVRQVAKFLDRLKVRPDLIVSSPLPRASQTAKIAAEYLKAKLREDESLAPGFGMRELRTVLRRHRSKSSDAGRARTGFYNCHFGADRRFAQTFQSRRRIARRRSGIRGRKTSVAFPAKIRAQSEVVSGEWLILRLYRSCR